MLETNDKTNSAHHKQDEDESKMKEAMFNNHKYKQAMTDILPWLDNRGLLDWK